MIEEARFVHLEESDTRQGDLEAALEVVLADSGDSSEGPHPVKAIPGEKLPEGYSQSYAGFLLRDEKRVVKVNQEVVK